MEQSGIPPSDLSGRRQSSWSIPFAPSEGMTIEFRGFFIAYCFCWMIALIFNLGKPWVWHYGEKVWRENSDVWRENNSDVCDHYFLGACFWNYIFFLSICAA